MKGKNSFVGFLNFEVLITPKIIVLVYWISTIILIIAAIVGIHGENDKLFGSALLTILILRIAFEMMILAFKNNEFARRSCEALESLVAREGEQQKQMEQKTDYKDLKPPPKNR